MTKAFFNFCVIIKTLIKQGCISNFGTLSPKFSINIKENFYKETLPQVHALLTEDYLVNRKLNDQGVLDAVVTNYLQLDLDASTPDLDPVLSDVAYRTRLVKALFYKVYRVTRHV